MTRIFYIVVLALSVIVITAAADSVTLDLTPSSGAASGMPGDTVGWGYSIDNDTEDYLIVANSYFCDPGQDPLFTTCSPSLGIYSDFIANNGTLLLPDSSADQSFDASSDNGVGQYVISSSATPGESDTGSVVVLYELFDADFNQIGGTIELSAPAEVMVTGSVSSVPEPRLAILLGFGFIAFIGFRARRLRIA
jgi:hypothetical protein